MRVVCPQAWLAVSVKPEDVQDFGSKLLPVFYMYMFNVQGSRFEHPMKLFVIFLYTIRPLVLARLIYCAARVEGSHLQHLPAHRDPSRHRCGSVQAWV